MVTSDHAATGSTRMLFLGDAALTDGFQLIGFETWPDPTPDRLDQILGDLIETRASAFIILDSQLIRRGSKLLERVRREGGRIVIVEVPPLNEPGQLHSGIYTQVRSLTEGTESLTTLSDT